MVHINIQHQPAPNVNEGTSLQHLTRVTLQVYLRHSIAVCRATFQGHVTMVSCPTRLGLSRDQIHKVTRD